MKTKVIILFFLFILPYSIGQEKTNDKEIKAEIRKEKRYIHSKSKFITFSGGVRFTPFSLHGSGKFIRTGYQYEQYVDFFSINYEHSFKNNLFLEVEYNFKTINHYYQFTVPNNQSKYGLSERITHGNDLLIGAGYRITLKNNFNLFNVHSGLYFGITNKMKLSLPYNTSTSYYDANGIYFATTSHSILNYSNLYCGAYFGISKDLRLSTEVRLNFKMTYKIGFTNILSGEYEVVSISPLINDDVTNFKVKGDGLTLSIGLKVLLNNKFLNHEN